MISITVIVCRDSLLLCNVCWSVYLVVVSDRNRMYLLVQSDVRQLNLVTSCITCDLHTAFERITYVNLPDKTHKQTSSSKRFDSMLPMQTNCADVIHYDCASALKVHFNPGGIQFKVQADFKKRESWRSCEGAPSKAPYEEVPGVVLISLVRVLYNVQHVEGEQQQSVAFLSNLSHVPNKNEYL